jgi:hypothetical protein
VRAAETAADPKEKGALSMRKIVAVLALALTLWVAGPVHADEIFVATLMGAQETPPNNSPAMGTGVFTLNDAHTVLHFDYDFSGLVAPSTATHFHNGPAGVAGDIVRPVMADEGFVAGTTSGHMVGDWTSTDTAHPQLTPMLVAELEAGNIYANVHSTQFPGGEVRGQLTPSPAPEPSSLLLFGIGGAALLGYGWRRRKRA